VITRDQALTGNYFWLVQSNRIDNKPNRVITVRRSGKTKTWKTRPNDWDFPVKYGMYQSFHLTQDHAADIFISQADAQLAIDYPGVDTETARARKIASMFHGGQGSALYAFASTGVVPFQSSILKEISDCQHQPGADMGALTFLYRFVVESVIASGQRVAS